MRNFVICAVATVALSGCVAKDSPAPREPEYVPAKCLLTDDALRQRAFVDDFAKEPLLVPAWQRRPIVVGNLLVDPATGKIRRVLSEHDPEITFVARWLNRIEFGGRGQYLGSTEPTSWPVAKGVKQDRAAAVQVHDPGGRLRWERQLQGSSLKDIHPTLPALIVQTDVMVQGLSWSDGNTMWERPGKAIVECYDDSNLCLREDSNVLCVRIGDGVQRWRLPVSDPMRVSVRSGGESLWLVSEGTFYHEMQTRLVDEWGNIIFRQTGWVAGAGQIGNVTLVALETAVVLLGPGGSVISRIPLGVDRRRDHAQIISTGDGRAVLMYGSGVSTGENWTTLIDPISKSAVWSHNTPRIVPEHDAYSSLKHVEIRAGLVYVVTTEFITQTIEVLDMSNGKLLRYWAYAENRE